MPRFFIEGISPEPGDRITLSEEDSRHVSLSLRMKRGDALTLCDGRGTDCECVAVDFAGAVTVEVVSVSPSASEPPYGATVFQAEVKGDKFDTVIQKAVELAPSGSYRSFHRTASAVRTRATRIKREKGASGSRSKRRNSAAEGPCRPSARRSRLKMPSRKRRAQISRSSAGSARRRRSKTFCAEGTRRRCPS